MTDNELVVMALRRQCENCRERKRCDNGISVIPRCYIFDAITLIETLLAENAELKEAQRWVPVSERLPEEPYGCLLIVEEDDHGGEPRKVLLPYFAGYDGDGWNDGDGQRVPFEVTHWQPLPQPPKGE